MIDRKTLLDVAIDMPTPERKDPDAVMCPLCGSDMVDLNISKKSLAAYMRARAARDMAFAYGVAGDPIPDFFPANWALQSSFKRMLVMAHDDGAKWALERKI